MKVLTATMKTNGLQTGDYSFCTPGELIWLPPTCDTDRLDRDDGGCGCGRGFGGLNSHRATTTARIDELAFTPADLDAAVRSSLADQGWITSPLDSRADQEIAAGVVGYLRSIAERFAVGDVIRRCGDLVYLHPGIPGATGRLSSVHMRYDFAVTFGRCSVR